MSDSASRPRDTTGLPGGRNSVPTGFEEGLDWVRRGALEFPRTQQSPSRTQSGGRQNWVRIVQNPVLDRELDCARAPSNSSAAPPD